PASRQLGLQCLDDGRRAMTQDQRSPGTDEIEVSVPVDVPDPGTLAPDDKGRDPPDRAMGSNRAVDAAGDQAFRLLEQRRRSIDAYDSSRSRSKASFITDASSAGSGLSRSAGIGPFRKLTPLTPMTSGWISRGTAMSMISNRRPPRRDWKTSTACLSKR